MNEQLPSVERSLADQLARRSAGRPPAGLLDEVLSAVEATPSAPVVRLAGFRSRARVSGALVGLAAVVTLVAALVAIPALHTSPAATSLPTDRALATAELATLMAGPALPTNTALVADVTIASNPDVCPMNRYPTLGVVEGMRGQVCVMASGMTYDLQPSGAQSGVFAFRYLAPGVLGLLGKITTPSSGLAFKVADEWPLQGKTFVVDGWLGSSKPDGLSVSCAELASPGDVLSPNGSADCPPSQDWLADTADPSALASPNAYQLARQSIDPLARFGNARLVGAYGARQIDGIDERNPQAGAVRGRYVVRSETGACPGSSPASSVGCAHWLVLAKLGDNLQLTQATPRPSLAALSDYPTRRALGTAELGRLLDDGTLKVKDAVVADVTLTTGDGCPMIDSAKPMNLAGRIAGVEPAACVYTGTTAFEPGHAVLLVEGSRTFSYLGTASQAAAGRLVVAPSDTWPNGKTILVDGWLHAMNVVGNDPAMCPDATPDQDGNIGCTTYSLNDSQSDTSPGDKPVAMAPGTALPPGHGVYVLAYDAAATVWRVQVRLTDLSGASPATPIPEPTATPVAIATAHPGYPFDRALTSAELAARLADKSLAAGTIFVASVAIKETATCAGADNTNKVGILDGMASQVCVAGLDFNGSASGVFALRYISSGQLESLGQVEPLSATQLVRPPEQWPIVMNGSKTILVAGRLLQSGSKAALASADSTSPDLLVGQSVVVDPSANLAGQSPSDVAVFVVRAEAVAVPGDSINPAPGDGVLLRVIGKVDDPASTGPTPTTTPTAATSVDSTYPATRAMTTDELERFLQADGVKQKVVVANTFIETGTPCPSLDGYPSIGKIGGADICVVGIGDAKAEHRPAKQSGIFAFRVLDARTLGFMGDLTEEPTGKFSYTSAQTWPSGKTILVTGWLASQSGLRFCPAQQAGDPLDPNTVSCGFASWMLDAPMTTQLTATSSPQPSSHPKAIAVSSLNDGSAWQVKKTFLLRDGTSGCGGETGRACGWRTLAVVDQVAIPPSSASTPSSPAPAASTSAVSGPQGGPLTLATLYAKWQTARDQIAGHIVIVKGLLPASMACLTPEGLSLCDYAIAGEGYWVVQIDSSGKISLLGEAKQPPNGIGAFSADQLATSNLADGSYLVINGSLRLHLNTCDTKSPGRPYCWLAAFTSGGAASVDVHFASQDLLPGTDGSTSGTFLVKVGPPSTTSQTYTIVAAVSAVS